MGINILRYFTDGCPESYTDTTGHLCGTSNLVTITNINLNFSFIFRYLNKYDQKLAKSCIGSIHLLVLYSSRCWKSLFRNINNEINNQIKYSKTNMCRNMKYYMWDLLSYLRKTNEGRPLKVSFWKVKNILQQTEHLEEEIGIFGVKKLIVKQGISPSFSKRQFLEFCERLELI